MATLYSSLYGTPPNPESAGGAQIYRGPGGDLMQRAGGLTVIRGQLDIPAAGFGATDIAKLFDVMNGAKLVRMVIVPSADLDAGNSFTFNLGWFSSGASAFAAASTGLQAATAFTLSADQVIAAVAAGSGLRGDTMQLTRVAGSLSTGTLRFLAEVSHGG